MTKNMTNNTPKKVFGTPIKPVPEEKMLEEMKVAKDGTIFILEENRIKHHEGDDSVEVVMAKIIRSKDTPTTPKKGEVIAEVKESVCDIFYL